MSTRTALILAFAAMGLSAAQAGTVSTWVGGEAGWIDVTTPSTVTRGQVANELIAFRRNPVAADGGQFVGGEVGYILPQHTYARVNGEWVCTDKIAHNPPPPAIKTPAERSAFRAQYPA